MNLKTHRFSYELHVGKIPKGKLVCHKCDVPACVNPKHLFIGTWKSNAHDMIKKGRKADVRGELNGCAKLKKSDISEIRRLNDKNKATSRYVRKEFSQHKIAKMYGVTQAMVSRIITGKAWSHT